MTRKILTIEVDTDLTVRELRTTFEVAVYTGKPGRRTVNGQCFTRKNGRLLQVQCNAIRPTSRRELKRILIDGVEIRNGDELLFKGMGARNGIYKAFPSGFVPKGCTKRKARRAKR